MKRLGEFCLTAILVCLLLSGKCEAFSDKLEPVYPHLTAATRTVDEIYDRCDTSDKYVPVTDGIKQARKEIIQFYKDLGIDVSYDIENRFSSKLIDNFPRTYEKKRPDNGNYMSVDYCANQAISEDAARYLLPDEALKNSRNKFFFNSVMNSFTGIVSGAMQNGLPIVEGRSDMKKTRIARISGDSKRNVVYGHMVNAPEDMVKYLYQGTTGDRHCIFVDTETEKSVSTWLTVAAGAPGGYGFGENYVIPGYDVTCSTMSSPLDINGMSEDTYGISTTAANVTMLPFLIKSEEISDPDAEIEHALAVCLSSLWKARVYPATATDSTLYTAVSESGMDRHQAAAYDCVPYGACLQLDPSIDIDAIYEAGKLSLPAKKVLKAMQKYGFYHVDYGAGYVYTATTPQDWVKADDNRWNVPVRDGKQAQYRVQEEITEFMKGNPFFGFDGKVLPVYIVAPQMKYAQMDINNDGKIDEADKALTEANIGQAKNDTNSGCDVNCDGIIDETDSEIYYRYLNDLPMHSRELCDVTFLPTDSEKGKVVLAGSKSSNDFGEEVPEGVRKILRGGQYTFTAVAYPGYEFVRWTGDLAGYDEDMVILTADRSITVGAEFKAIEDKVPLELEISGNGEVKAYQYDYVIEERPVKDEYYKGAVVNLLAVPDEGYEFLMWDGDVRGTAKMSKGLYMTEPKKVKAIFVEKEMINQVKMTADSWKCDNPAVDAEAYVIEDDKISFKSWNYKYNLINNEVKLPKNYKLFAEISTNTVNDARIIFQYKNSKNYYYLLFDNEGTLELGKMLNGIKTVLKRYSGDGNFNPDGISWQKYPTYLEIEMNNNLISVSGYDMYKNGITYFSGVFDDTINGTSIGVGGDNNGSVTFSNIRFIDLLAG